MTTCIYQVNKNKSTMSSLDIQCRYIKKVHKSLSFGLLNQICSRVLLKVYSYAGVHSNQILPR